MTQESRPDRWKLARAEFDRVGLEVDKFLSYPGTDAFNSFNRSQKGMITECFGHGSLLTFEDDVLFQDMSHLEAGLNSLPIHWDMIYLGANITEERPYRVGPNLFRIKSAWTTHAVGYSEPVMKYIIDNYDPEKDGMYDDWLSRNVLPKFNCFIVSPMVCWQRPGYSDLWGRQTDYEPCFADGNAKMAAL